MQFTPRDVVQGARDRAPRPREVRLTQDQIVRQFNDITLDLAQKYLDHDEERLAERVTINPTDVASDPIDVTKSTTIEWLKINSISWRGSSSGEYEDPVVVVPQEARHRADHEYGYLGWPIAYFIDRDRSLKKISRWDGVHDLEVFGTLRPTKVSPGDWDAVLDYPAPFYRTLQMRFLINLSGSLNIDGERLQLAFEELERAEEALHEDAESHVSPTARVEDVPHLSFYR